MQKRPRSKLGLKNRKTKVLRRRGATQLRKIRRVLIHRIARYFGSGDGHRGTFFPGQCNLGTAEVASIAC